MRIIIHKLYYHIPTKVFVFSIEFIQLVFYFVSESRAAGRVVWASLLSNYIQASHRGAPPLKNKKKTGQKYVIIEYYSQSFRRESTNDFSLKTYQQLVSKHYIIVFNRRILLYNICTLTKP